MLATDLGAGNAAVSISKWTETLVSSVTFFYSFNQIHLSLRYFDNESEHTSMELKYGLC